MRNTIRTLQVPKRGGGAFSVIPAASSTAAFNGQNIVTGSPGTTRVPSPRPAALSDGELGGPYNQPSSVAPDYFCPAIYVARVNPTLHFPGRILCDNVVPVPAGVISSVALQSQYRTRVGGRATTASYRPWTQWPIYNTRGKK
jgi:hypothetical protein